MKLKDFLNEHSQWVSNNVPGEPLEILESADSPSDWR